jgi:preprotein translocase subunit SecF
MAAPPRKQKFFELISPDLNIDFIGTRKIWIGISVFAVLLSVAMLFLNAFVIPGRGQMLNWSVEFKGGSEIVTRFKKPTAETDITRALEAGGFHGVEAFKYGNPSSNDYLVRMGAVTPISRDQAAKAEQSLLGKAVAGAKLQKLEWSEGGDKAYLRFDKTVDLAVLKGVLQEVGIKPTSVQPFGRTEDHVFEVTLVSLEVEVKKALEADSKFGPDSVSIEQVNSVGAKAGQQLRNDGIKATLGSILLIVIYIAFRFDFRYGPGTVVALFHDAIITIGAMAITYKEFSLTTLAALLTIIGYSMNDTIVVFDRIRENAAKFRDRPFAKMVNQSVNETLPRTVLTAATLFFCTMAMNVLGTGVIRDFAFAMNVGVIVGVYSTTFIASPVLIWLNDKYVAAQKKQGQRSDRVGRQPVRRKGSDKDTDSDSAEA